MCTPAEAEIGSPITAATVSGPSLSIARSISRAHSMSPRPSVLPNGFRYWSGPWTRTPPYGSGPYSAPLLAPPPPRLRHPWVAPW